MAAFGCGGMLFAFVRIEPSLIFFPFAAIAAVGAWTTLAGGGSAEEADGSGGNGGESA